MTFTEFKEKFNAPSLYGIHLYDEEKEYVKAIINSNILTSKFIVFSQLFLTLYFSVITVLMVFLSIILNWGYWGIIPIILFNLFGYIPLDIFLYYKHVYIPYINSNKLMSYGFENYEKSVEEKISAFIFEVNLREFSEKIQEKLLEVLNVIKKSTISDSRKNHYLNVYIKEILSIVDLDKNTEKYVDKILEQLNNVVACIKKEESCNDYKEASIEAGLKTIESFLAQDGGASFE